MVCAFSTTHARPLAVRPLGPSRLPAPDDAVAAPSRAASSSSRTSTPRTAISSSGRGTSTSRRTSPVSRRPGRTIVRIPTYDDDGFDPAEARRLTEEAIRAGDGGRHLPALSHGRPLARVRRLPRAPGGRAVRAGRHEARPNREAGARPAALLLRGAGRADPGRARRARPRRERPRRARDVPRSRSSSRTTAGCASGSSARSPPSRTRTRGRATTAGSATSGIAATCSGSTTTT